MIDQQLHGSPRPGNPWALLAGPPAPQVLARLDLGIWWLGAHGGAGETTLAALVPGTRAAEHSWPSGPLRPRVVLVARTNITGLQAAQTHARLWVTGSTPAVELLGLVLIADAPGRLPRPLRHFADVIAGGFPKVWRLDWLEELRLVPDPAAIAATRQITGLGEDITALASSTDRKARS